MEVAGKVKDPHQQSEYVKVDEQNTGSCPTDNGDGTTPRPAYYYVDKDEAKLASLSFAKTALIIIAFMLQITALFLPAQSGAMYVSNHVESYGLLYVLFTIFGMFGTSVWLLIVDHTRYKIAKRIPAKHAPKKGFAKRAYFGQELYIAVTAAMTVFQLSFVCISFDGWGMGALIICTLSLAAAVAARQITHLTLKNAQLVCAPDRQPESGRQDGKTDN